MSKTAMLYCEADADVLSTQTQLFNKAGYAVVPIQGRAAMEQAVKFGGFDIAILGHTLSRDDRHHLPYMVKKSSPAARVVVLHASGRHPRVDVAVDSRFGDRVVLDAIAQATVQPVTTSI
jgi:DNA-binding NtrC family response regulator